MILCACVCVCVHAPSKAATKENGHVHVYTCTCNIMPQVKRDFSQKPYHPLTIITLLRMPTEEKQNYM